MAVFQRKYRDKKTGRMMRCEVYSYYFIFHGQRYRGSTECTTKTRAKAFADDLRKRLERGLAGMPTEEPETRVRTVASALNDYQLDYSVGHAPTSIAWVADRGAHLRRLLGSEIAASLGEKRVQQYRRKRMEENAGARTIDMETAILARAFGAKWSSWWPNLKPLDKGSTVGKVIAHDDERRILEHAAKSASPYLYTYLLIAFSTGMRSGEIRFLKWDRFSLADSHSDSYLRVGASKTETGRDRAIPMDERLWKTMTKYRAWYVEKLGSARPEWFVFPYSTVRKPVDPSRSATTIKSAWRRLKIELGIAARLHDARHTVATAMELARVSDAKRKYLMGHTSENVIKRYTHLQAEDCREDLERALKQRRNSSRVPTVSTTVKGKRRLAIVDK
jgi:integrase